MDISSITSPVANDHLFQVTQANKLLDHLHTITISFKFGIFLRSLPPSHIYQWTAQKINSSSNNTLKSRLGEMQCHSFGVHICQFSLSVDKLQ